MLLLQGMIVHLNLPSFLLKEIKVAAVSDVEWRANSLEL